jgi:hypothetical protein
VLACLGVASRLVCVSMLFEHVSHWVPGPTKSEASGPVKVFEMEPCCKCVIATSESN